ncbi:ankyrin repeat-containing domain protein [Mycena alexandri]|uniref:Ankyrin repeat-containing domain protein n=1 Tax=Mycena alexandri TaxID=1745969 RepID=A0AAD6TGR6_9AGAR|nr:ankyrin repeat-containing domain protein [Mycena alexandri]
MDRTRIIDWLSPINFFERQEDIFNAREPGTGDWLLADSRFKQWEASSGEILWCHGMPGAGKTVLSSVVVDHLESHSGAGNTTVACVYLNHKETQIQTPSNLLAALWRQLVFGKTISTESMVQKLHQKHLEKRTRPSLADIHDVLRSVVSEWSRVYIVVDALDEYPEDQRRILLEHLTVLDSTVNLMLTSRPHIALDTVLPLGFGELEIRGSDTDIRKYVDQRIQNSERLSLLVRVWPRLREEIILKIVRTAGGMFLLAKLNIESLAMQLNIKSVQDALEKLPQDLDAAYRDTMERINQQNASEKQLALATLTWVANAKRLLTVAELQEALAIELGSTRLNPDNRPEISIVLAVCAGLVIVDDRSSVVRLVHFSTQLYLDDLFPDAHTYITRLLLTYLGFDEVKASAMPSSSRRNAGLRRFTTYRHGSRHQLLEYCSHCLLHAAGQPEVALRAMIIKFLGQAFEWHSVWRGSRVPVPWSFYAWPSHASPLWIAASANLLGIAKYLLDTGASPGSQYTEEVSALGVASYYGHADMVRLLIKKRVSNWGRNPLAMASEHGHTQIVRFLLDKGADVNIAGEFPGTALQAACRGGKLETIRLLLAEGANINASDPDTGSALYVACEAGQLETACFLFDKGASIHAEGGYYGNMLQAACAAGATEIVHFLLNHGAVINEVGGYHGSALQAATEKGYMEIVQLLLSNGTDVNAVGGHHGNALQAGSARGRIDIVRLLLEQGADVNAAGGYYHSALQAADKNGQTDIVQLLLESGAQEHKAEDEEQVGEVYLTLPVATSSRRRARPRHMHVTY